MQYYLVLKNMFSVNMAFCLRGWDEVWVNTPNPCGEFRGCCHLKVKISLELTLKVFKSKLFEALFSY